MTDPIRMTSKDNEQQQQQPPPVAVFRDDYIFQRSEPEAALLQAYHRQKRRSFPCYYRPALEDDPTIVNNDNSPSLEFVLITGPSGCGKSTLAINTLRSQVEQTDQGFFLHGKSDQLQTTKVPYAPFVAAFTQFTQRVLKKHPEKVASLQSAIHEAIASELSLLTSMIPALVEIVGTKDADADAKEKEEFHDGKENDDDVVSCHLQTTPNWSEIGTGNHKQVAHVFCKFVHAISSSFDHHPIVLFLDDLQWLDAESLELLSALAGSLNREDLESLIIMGACRGDEVDPTDPLSTKLCEMEEKSVLITNIALSNLSRQETSDMVAGMLMQHNNLAKDGICDTSGHEKLADWIFRQTQGNIFFIHQRMKSLQEEGALVGSENFMEFSGGNVDDEGDVDMFVAERINKLPPKLKGALEILSCIGTEVEESIVRHLLSPDAFRALTFLEEKSILIFNDNARTIRFGHDRYQSVVFSLIPSTKQHELHLFIGRTLSTKFSERELGENIFLVAGQLGRGSKVIKKQKERDHLAFLCLQAARSAVAMAAFRVASEYVDFGIFQLGNDPWRRLYGLSLALHNAAAEIFYLNANFEGVDPMTAEILENARSFQDKWQAYTTKVCSLGARGDIQGALSAGLAVLRDRGIRFPQKPNRPTVFFELMRIKVLFARKSDAEILKMPIMEDRDALGATLLLNVLILYAYVGSPALAPILATRSLRLAKKYGLSPMCSFAFANIGAVLSAGLRDLQVGYRFGQIAFMLLDLFQVRQWLPRTYIAVCPLVNPWKIPIRDCVDPVHHAHLAALENGDIEISILSGHSCNALRFSTGQPLRPLTTLYGRLRELAITYKQKGVRPLVEAKFQQILNLGGTPANPLVLTGEVMNEETAIECAKQIQNWLVPHAIYIWKCEIACFLLDYQSTIKFARTAHECRKKGAMELQDVWWYTALFYEAVAALALAQDNPASKRQLTRLGRRNLANLQRWGRCAPGNFNHMIALVKAERACLQRDEVNALKWYDQSIDWAAKGSFTHHHALAVERKALSLRRFGREKDSMSAMAAARCLYDEWGSRCKLERMDADRSILGPKAGNG